VLEIAIERDADPAKILEGSGLGAEALDTPDLRVPASEAACIVWNTLEQTGDRGLGFELGLRTRPTQHGYVGFAAMSANTLREAMEVGTRFLHLRQRDAVPRPRRARMPAAAATLAEVEGSRVRFAGPLYSASRPEGPSAGSDLRAGTVPSGPRQ
jgi:hypothetical protein